MGAIKSTKYVTTGPELSVADKASDLSFEPVSGIDATNTQAAIAENRLELQAQIDLLSGGVLELEAYENLSSGSFVYIYDDSGQAKLRRATNANKTSAAVGFVLQATLAGSTTQVFPTGKNTQLGGLAIGRVYLGVNGLPTSVPPVSSNSIVQPLGTAESGTTMVVDIQNYTVLA